MAASDERLNRLETKLDSLQESFFDSHNDLKSCILDLSHRYSDEISDLKIKVERQASQFSLLGKIAGSGIFISILAFLKEMFIPKN